VNGSKPVKGREHRLTRELLYAMESARSRLAVAIALENKATPRERWRQYLETEDRMRQCVRRIRFLPYCHADSQAEWLKALSLLKQPLPAVEKEAPVEAQVMCRRIMEVLDILDNTGACE
jgi:hypothetical protein